jgi:putative Mn2+ efflux pump MntP
MSRLTSGAGRFLAEALILLPALTLGLVWTGVVIVGLFHATTVSRHRPAIEELMTALLLVCVGCFTLGVLLFSASRQRRWTR